MLFLKLLVLFMCVDILKYLMLIQIKISCPLHTTVISLDIYLAFLCIWTLEQKTCKLTEI